MSEKRQLVDDVTVQDGVITSGTMATVSGISKGSKKDGTLVVFCDALEHDLNFTGTTLEELLFLATATVIIKLQGGWRTIGHGCKSENGGVTNVHEFINRPINRTMRPAEDIVLERATSGEMSQEALAKLIEQLKAKQVK